MKRIIKTFLGLQDTIELEVVINFDYAVDSVVASLDWDPPKNIRKRNRINEIQFGVMKDIVDSLISCLEYYNFPILRQYTSKKSYTYYIRFQPVDRFGRESTPVGILFRIGDHPIKNKDKEVDPENVVIVSVVFGKQVFDNRIDFIADFGKMCQGLAENKLSVIDMMNKYR